MALVPYDHVEAPRRLRLPGDWTAAFMPGDPIPVDTAKTLGLLDEEGNPTEDGVVVIASSFGRGSRFVDDKIHVGVTESRQAAAAEAAEAAEAPTPPADATGTAAGTGNPPPPAAPAKTGSTATTTTATAGAGTGGNA